MRWFIFSILSLCGIMCASAQEMPCDSVLRRMAAKMLMVGFKGDSVYEGSDAYGYVHDLGVGAIVLFDVDLTGDATIGSRNVTSVERLKKLTAQLQEWSAEPLLIAADQEGGRVARLKPQYGFSPTVSAEYLGQCDSEDTTRFYAARMAQEMADCGVNVNLAPILDIANDSCPAIGQLHRGFSDNPEKVAAQASWFVDEMQKRGVTCVMKHFPGHGNSRADTHYGLVDVTATWQPYELQPFQALIDNGQGRMVMTAHIFNKNIDPDYPMTLSHKALTELLREKMGFNGVIITDDLYMEGIISQYGIEEALVLAINAGADLMCVGNNIKTGFEADRPYRLVDIIVAAVKDGRIPLSRLSEAAARINSITQQ